jgi:hypothetical protein
MTAVTTSSPILRNAPSARSSGRAADPPAGTHPSGGAGVRPGRHRGHGQCGSRSAPRVPGPAQPGRRPSLEELVAAFATIYLEVESGRRRRAQAAALMDPLLYARLERIWVRPGAPGRVVTVIGHPVADEVYEAVAVVQRGARFGSLAIRLAKEGSRWTVTHASRPEDGPLPDPVVPLPVDEPDAFDLVGHQDAAWNEVGEPAPVPVA